MVHSVKSLTADQRSVIESLIGRRVAESESINLQVLPLDQILPDGIPEEQRSAALSAFRGYFAKVDSMREDISQEEEDAIVEEALRSIKPHYQARR